MKRKKVITIHISRIIEQCNSEELFYLLYKLQHIDIFYGYSVAMLIAFENQKISLYTDSEISEIMKNGVYFRLFSEWLEETL